MSEHYKIYIDAGQPATLNNGASIQTDCATLREAVWHGIGRRLNKRYEQPLS